MLLVGVAAAVALSSTQPARYEAASQVLISRTNLGNVLTGTPDPAAQEFDFNRIIQTQANLAQVPRVAQRTLDASRLRDRTPEQFLAQSTVTTDPNTDIITLVVQDADRAIASQLASNYAREFVGYKRDATVNRLIALQRDLEKEVAQLSPRSVLADQDRVQLRRIRNLISLGDSSISVVRTARSAEQIQPQPLRNALLGLVLGLVAGIALAFVVDALDTRVRRGEEIEELFGMPLLARLPAPPRALRRGDRIVALERPESPDADGFRSLRTALAFADIDGQARSIVVSSAIQSEGKSTTVANLAVTLARGGRRVILVDLDFRRPYLERFFDLPATPGATNVVLGETAIDDALSAIEFGPHLDAGAGSNGHANGIHGANGMIRVNGANGRSDGAGPALQVMPAGTLPPNVGEFVASAALSGLLTALRERCDVLLIDTPPLLQVGDTMALTAHVDALVVVTRLGVVRRHMIEEVKRLLTASPITVLGVVITDATLDEPGMGYGNYYDLPAKSSRRTARPRSRA